MNIFTVKVLKTLLLYTGNSVHAKYLLNHQKHKPSCLLIGAGDQILENTAAFTVAICSHMTHYGNGPHFFSLENQLHFFFKFSLLYFIF